MNKHYVYSVIGMYLNADVALSLQFTMQAQKLEAEAISKLEVMEKFERERHIFQVFIKGLNEKV